MVEIVRMVALSLVHLALVWPGVIGTTSPSDLVLPVLGGAVVFGPATALAAWIGWRGGLHHARLGDTCGRAWGLAIVIAYAILLSLAGLAILLTGLMPDAEGILMLLVMGFVLSALGTAIPAAGASVIAYNFGAQRRARDELALRNSLPPRSDD